MLRIKSLARGMALVFVAFLGGVAGSWMFQPQEPAAGIVDPGAKGSLIGTFGVGGVVTREGQLWQYRPDKGRWMSLDESFALEGQATTVIPLPVPVDQIRFMETFGFLVSQDDACWLYNVEQHRWEEVGKPPSE